MHFSSDTAHFEQGLHLVYRNVAVARMINNPINRTKRKRTLHLPLGGSSEGASLGIWMDKCAHFNVHLPVSVTMCGFVCQNINSLMKLFMLYILQLWHKSIYLQHQRKMFCLEFHKAVSHIIQQRNSVSRDHLLL